MRKSAFVGVILAGLMGGGAQAALVANPPTMNTQFHLDATWSWITEVGGGPKPIASRFWLAELDLTLQGNNWTGKLRAQHSVHPHDENNAPMFTYDFAFPRARAGAGLGDVGKFSASALHPGMGHEDSVSFLLNRNADPRLTKITISLDHPMIPLPASILSLGTGLAAILALAFRRRSVLRRC